MFTDDRRAYKKFSAVSELSDDGSQIIFSNYFLLWNKHSFALYVFLSQKDFAKKKKKIVLLKTS